jgi:hypothetical protein
MKVLYVASVPHSGSTLLANALGELDGFFSAGELHFLPHVLELGRSCGCGEPFSACPVWSQVLAEAAPLRPDDRWLLARTLPLLAAGRAPGAGGGAIERYLDSLGALYPGVGRATGCRVLVDSSKSPSYAYLLSRVPGVELYVVHLVRDARATAFSWRRKRNRLSTSPALFGAIWAWWNAVLPVVARRATAYRLQRYEDFVRDPDAALRGLAAFVGERVSATPIVDGRTLRLGVNHTAAGNDNRFRVADVPLRLDDEWRARTDARSTAATLLAAWPLQLRYGYGLTTSSADAVADAPSGASASSTSR